MVTVKGELVMRKPTILIIASGYDHGCDDDFYLECADMDVLNEVEEKIYDLVNEEEADYDDVLDYIEKDLKDYFDKGLVQWVCAPYDSRIVVA
jgi:hypothetical protein